MDDIAKTSMANASWEFLAEIPQMYRPKIRRQSENTINKVGKNVISEQLYSVRQ